MFMTELYPGGKPLGYLLVRCWGLQTRGCSLGFVAPTPGVKGVVRNGGEEVIAHSVPGVHFQLDIPGEVITVPA